MGPRGDRGNGAAWLTSLFSLDCCAGFGVWVAGVWVAGDWASGTSVVAVPSGCGASGRLPACASAIDPNRRDVRRGEITCRFFMSAGYWPRCAGSCRFVALSGVSQRVIRICLFQARSEFSVPSWPWVPHFSRFLREVGFLLWISNLIWILHIRGSCTSACWFPKSPLLAKDARNGAPGNRKITSGGQECPSYN
jgi:hypothetical protein